MDEHNVTVAIMAAILLAKGPPTKQDLEDAASAAEKLYELIRRRKFALPANWSCDYLPWCFLSSAIVTTYPLRRTSKMIPNYFIDERSEGNPAVKAKSF